MRSRLILFVLLGGLAIGLAGPVWAQTASDSSSPLLIECDQTSSGTPGIVEGTECTISDFFNQFILLAQWGLTLAVILGVLMMVYGGFQWITAAGRSSKIDEGKRVVIGTLVGLAISFSAYIIINFSITAITGTTTRSLNPFAGPIATVFGGLNEERPFGGSGTPIDTVSNCHDRWDNGCADQIYCADVSDTTGDIRDIQQLLNGKNCACGNVDGCFGSQTAVCVRRFQIANDLPPTGEVDSRTESLIQGAGKFCTNDPSDTSGALAQQVNAVNRLLPTPSVSTAQNGDRTKHGCCVIQRNSDTPIFCADQMSQRTCLSLGAGNRFIADASCFTAPEARTICGFCHLNGRCFGQATARWCQNNVSPTMSFAAQIGLGNPLCSAGYISSLRTIAP